MKKIKLTKGQFALVDDSDFEWLSQCKWYFCNGYAMRNKPNRTGLIRMHRIINNTPIGYFTDHINRNKLDNRKTNLRTTNKSGNEHNTLARKNSKSGEKNVLWDRRRNLWRVEIMLNLRKYFIGYFKSLEFAVINRDKFRGQHGI